MGRYWNEIDIYIANLQFDKSYKTSVDEQLDLVDGKLFYAGKGTRLDDSAYNNRSIKISVNMSL